MTCNAIRSMTRGVYCYSCKETCNSPISLGEDRYSGETAQLEQINDNYCCLMFGGKFRVGHEGYDHSLGRDETYWLRKEDFISFFQNKKINITQGDKVVTKNLGKGWLDWEHRRQYDRVVFDPSLSVPPTVYNLYRGLAVVPCPGDWSLFRDHLEKIICNGDMKIAKYVLCWMARIVQEPGGDRPGVSLVLKGGRGAGKGIFANYYGEIFGIYYQHLQDASRFTAKFNSFLATAILVFADEAIWAGDRSKEGQLKALLTEPTYQVEMKGIDSVTVKSNLNVIMATNNDWAVPAGDQERRFLVLEVSESVMQDHEYFRKLRAQMDNGGVAAMVHDLLQVDLSAVNLYQAPRTAALECRRIPGLGYTVSPI